MSGYLHLIVARRDFRLLQGEDALSTYTFNTGAAKHLFCRFCGVKSYYVPRSHPEGVSVNVHCIDKGSIEELVVSEFDGENWEQNVAKLSRLSD